MKKKQRLIVEDYKRQSALLQFTLSAAVHSRRKIVVKQGENEFFYYQVYYTATIGSLPDILLTL